MREASGLTSQRSRFSPQNLVFLHNGDKKKKLHSRGKTLLFLHIRGPNPLFYTVGCKKRQTNQPNKQKTNPKPCCFSKTGAKTTVISQLGSKPPLLFYTTGAKTPLFPRSAGRNPLYLPNAAPQNTLFFTHRKQKKPKKPQTRRIFTQQVPQRGGAALQAAGPGGGAPAPEPGPRGGG